MYNVHVFRVGNPSKYNIHVFSVGNPGTYYVQYMYSVLVTLVIHTMYMYSMWVTV